ncbi:hypothetical protein NDU88_008322 [Pleurodeles waltl]|uniref:Uncharacterized protein n=1 Tax=Pleurodeles waltl TaxID=8319 RepID=A0AAV7NVY7_PLEWA|nr:hypothetical protein NDU88_008322 [Pleurodeles waltl]
MVGCQEDEARPQSWLNQLIKAPKWLMTEPRGLRMVAKHCWLRYLQRTRTGVLLSFYDLQIPDDVVAGHRVYLTLCKIRKYFTDAQVMCPRMQREEEAQLRWPVQEVQEGEGTSEVGELRLASRAQRVLD